MKVRAQLQWKQVQRDLRRVDGTVRSVTAGVLNRHNTQVKRRMVNAMHGRWGISKRRCRRRNLIAKRSKANPSRLQAVGLTIVDLVPSRYFFNPNVAKGGRTKIARRGEPGPYPVGAVEVVPIGPRGGGGVFSITVSANKMRDVILARLAKMFDADFTAALKKRLANRKKRKRARRRR